MGKLKELVQPNDLIVFLGTKTSKLCGSWAFEHTSESMNQDCNFYFKCQGYTVLMSIITAVVIETLPFKIIAPHTWNVWVQLAAFTCSHPFTF